MYASERIDDQLNKETAQELGYNLALVESVIRFQFKSANQATQTKTSIELTDLGVFKATKSKLDRKLATLHRKLEYRKSVTQGPDLSEKRKATMEKICGSIQSNIEFLQVKRNTYEG